MSVNRNAIESARAAFNAGDLDGYLRLYGDDVVAHGYAPVPLDRDALVAFYRDIAAGLSGAQLFFHDVVEGGDRLCVRYSLAASHTGPLLGVPPTGRCVVLDGITIMSFRDGRVVERWQSADMLGLLTQLGVVPAQRVDESPVAAKTS